MDLITKKTYAHSNIEVIVDDNAKLCLNEKHIEEKLVHENLAFITNRYDPIYRKHRKIVNKPK